MAVIKPFRAVRYNPEFIVDYRGVVTPPYDLIDPCHRQKYHEASPYNSIRLILGLDRNGDHHGENRFIRAAWCWRRWRAEEILIQDEQPGFLCLRATIHLSPREDPAQARTDLPAQAGGVREPGRPAP